jgi:hypothetical protein
VGFLGVTWTASPASADIQNVEYVSITNDFAAASQLAIFDPAAGAGNDGLSYGIAAGPYYLWLRQENTVTGDVSSATQASPAPLTLT